MIHSTSGNATSKILIDVEHQSSWTLWVDMFAVVSTSGWKSTWETSFLSSLFSLLASQKDSGCTQNFWVQNTFLRFSQWPRYPTLSSTEFLIFFFVFISSPAILLRVFVFLDKMTKVCSSWLSFWMKPISSWLSMLSTRKKNTRLS